MKPNETKSVYERECRARRITPTQDEFEAWHDELKPFDPRDVDAGLKLWNRDTTPDETGQPHCKWLPRPAQLVVLVKTAIRERERQLATPKDLVGLKCPKCHRKSVAFPERGKAVRVSCPTCGVEQAETHREAA